MCGVYESDYFFFDRACERADAANDFVRALERPSRRAADAAFAIFGEVCLGLRFAIVDISFLCVSMHSTRIHHPSNICSIQPWAYSTLPATDKPNRYHDS